MQGEEEQVFSSLPSEVRTIDDRAVSSEAEQDMLKVVEISPEVGSTLKETEGGVLSPGGELVVFIVKLTVSELVSVPSEAVTLAV